MDDKKKKRVKRYLKEIVFLVLWSIIFIKLFIVDIEFVLSEKYFPGVVNFLSYRFIFYLFLLILVWYILGSKRFFKNLFYFIGFPFYVLFWKIPKVFLWNIPRYLFIKRYWIMIYSYINSIINNLWNLKFQLFKTVLFFSSLILVFNTNTKAILYIVLVSQLFLLIVLIVDKFKVAFQPIGLFKINEELSKLKDKKKKKDFIDNIISKVGDAEIVEDENTDKEKRLEKIEKDKKDNIEQIVLIKSLFSFLSSRLKDFLSRRTYIIVFFLKTLTAFVSAWLFLSIMNYTSYKISHSEFTLQIIPKFYNFIFYTFHSMLHGNIQGILPAGVLAQIIDIVAPITSILISGTLLTVFFTVKTDQYRDNLKEIIAFSDSQLDRLEKALIEYHKLTMDEALVFLESKKSFVCVIVKEINKIE